ncbi:Rv3212 family protein [Gordonia paraffinivorans]|uniref:Rv3212 family protein n=1 Tax=Gordonia paraffinivorans TaxID=175628 RepID=UPI001E3412B5|nr:PQQ-like beta-propeller repeat protein [Gordonia paraffinivorans]MCD2146856.1 PQQ-like beta-propeller repeat protein [Gordonia paraffinivorans]
MARVRPERRRPIDLVITAIIVVAVAVLCLIAWIVSPVRATQSTQAASEPPPVVSATAVPERFAARWSAGSDATVAPAVGKALVVTGDGGTVVGRDPRTGDEVWSYSRDLDLCAVDTAWTSSADTVLAVYRNSRGCSEVTALDAATGARRGARTSDADEELRLVRDHGYVVARGPQRLETWGSNLVRGIEYGRVVARVRPEDDPRRQDCRLFSAAISGDRLAVVERCAGDPGYRLTVLGAVLDDEERVREYGSSLITGDVNGPPPVLIAMSSSGIAVYDGGVNPAEPPSFGDDSGPTIRRFDTDAVAVGTNTVAGDASPPANSVPIESDGVVTYWTGKATVVLDAQSLRPIYQVPGALGPGQVMAGQLLLPSVAGISVRDVATGREVRSIPLQRSSPPDGVVSLKVVGDTVVEQRGRTVEAYGPA